MEQEHDERVTLAWDIAALSREQKLPKLEALLLTRRRQVRGPNDARAALEDLAARYGLKTRARRKRTGKKKGTGERGK